MRQHAVYRSVFFLKQARPASAFVIFLFLVDNWFQSVLFPINYLICYFLIWFCAFYSLQFHFFDVVSKILTLIPGDAP